MNICVVCRAIPFDRLPSEDEEALPHYSSLRELETSANTCSLCDLILLAAGEFALIRKNEKSGNSNANPGGWTTLTSLKSASGKLVSYSIVGGNRIPGLECGSDYKGPIYINP